MRVTTCVNVKVAKKDSEPRKTKNLVGFLI